MNTQELSTLLDRLRREPHETEWLEFKENHCEPQVLGEYLSALADPACLGGKPRGYLVFGVQDQSQTVVEQSKAQDRGVQHVDYKCLVICLNSWRWRRP